jgi:phosphohistidine phosphatase
MDVYLMQHGEALPAELDPSRSLSEVGQRSVEVVSRHAAACGVRIDRIVHSGKLRAVESALILARELGCADVRHIEGLGPGADVGAAAESLIVADRPGSVAIVGHLPFLDRLASLLVAGDPGAHVIVVRNGGLMKLVPSASASGFSVAWVITPEVARS